MGSREGERLCALWLLEFLRGKTVRNDEVENEVVISKEPWMGKAVILFYGHEKVYQSCERL